MTVREVIGDLLKIAFVCAGIYLIVNWDTVSPESDDVTGFAEKACVDEINARFEPSSIRAYAVNKTSNGYAVRVSIRLPRGTSAKVNCLTNPHGGVRDIVIEER
ncbi:hypothetical protein GWP57_13890 [Gammaproteobacteria bacterium]|jgi:hypothetical protein|nr:hypothetical protein [Gammaproteobacteria bacterium]